MKYYMGEVYDKTDNKEYKTLKGGTEAAKKANMRLFDEDGKLVEDFTPQEAQEGAEQPKEEKVENSTNEQEKGQEGAETDATGEAEAKSEEKTEAEPEGNEGQQSATMTDSVPEGALETDADGSVKTFDEDGNQVGTATAEEMQQAEETVTDTFEGIPAVRVSGKIRRVFEGNIRIRNRPSWNQDAVRGVSRFIEKAVTHVLEVDEKPMYRTSDGHFISGNPDLVEYIEE